MEDKGREGNGMMGTVSKLKYGRYSNEREGRERNRDRE